MELKKEERCPDCGMVGVHAVDHEMPWPDGPPSSTLLVYPEGYDIPQIHTNPEYLRWEREVLGVDSSNP